MDSNASVNPSSFGSAYRIMSGYYNSAVIDKNFGHKHYLMMLSIDPNIFISCIFEGSVF